MRPAAEDVSAVQARCSYRALVLAPAVAVPLKRQFGPEKRVRVDPEASPVHRHRVHGAAPVGKVLASPVGVFAVDAVVDAGRERPAVAEGRLVFELGAHDLLGEEPLRVLGALRGDVDHAVHRIGAPEGATRTADHLNPVDVLEQVILHIPFNAAIERRVDGPPVDQDQELVRQVRVESAGADGPVVGILLGHLKVVGQAQRLGNARGPRVDDVLVRDDLDRGGGVEELLGFLGDGGHLDVHQLLDAQLLQVHDRAGGRRLRRCMSRGKREAGREGARAKDRHALQRLDGRSWHLGYLVRRSGFQFGTAHLRGAQCAPAAVRERSRRGFGALCGFD